jgi:hypothetical protein
MEKGNTQQEEVGHKSTEKILPAKMIPWNTKKHIGKTSNSKTKTEELTGGNTTTDKPTPKSQAN